MSRDTVFQRVLEASINKAQKDVPEHMFILDTDGHTIGLPSQDILRGLSDSFVKNDVMRSSASPLTHASAFALRVLNSIDATKKIHKSIDFFLDNDDVKNWLTKQGISTDEEKQQLREDLKKHVEEQLSVKTKSNESREFVERMKEAYDQYAEAGQAEEFLGAGCAFLREVNEQISMPMNSDENAINQAKQIWDKYGDRVAEHSGIVMEPMYGALSNFTAQLSREIRDDLTTELVQNYGVYFGDSIKVKPVDFLKHAKTGEFTAAEKVWAQEHYRSLVNQGIFGSVEMDEFMVNGKSMFSKEQLQNKNEADFACSLVENMLKGEDVAIQKPGREPVHIDVNLIRSYQKEEKGFFQKFFDLLRDLFCPGAKQKAEMEMDLFTERFEANQEKNKVARQRIPFEELAGKNAAVKINTAPPKQKELSAEHKLEKDGMSAGN